MNIKWCKSNMKWGKFLHISPRAKLSLPDSSIDLLYGISVFTHLSELDQDFWLTEINRVIRGIAIVSTHGLYTVAASHWAREESQLDIWLEYGYKDADNPNPDIADVTPKNYYRDTAHTPEYIYRHWSQYLDIIDIVPGGISHHQDAIICRKKHT